MGATAGGLMSLALKTFNTSSKPGKIRFSADVRLRSP
jgi:hypothetical protein